MKKKVVTKKEQKIWQNLKTQKKYAVTKQIMSKKKIKNKKIIGKRL